MQAFSSVVHKVVSETSSSCSRNKRVFLFPKLDFLEVCPSLTCCVFDIEATKPTIPRPSGPLILHVLVEAARALPSPRFQSEIRRRVIRKRRSQRVECLDRVGLLLFRHGLFRKERLLLLQCRGLQRVSSACVTGGKKGGGRTRLNFFAVPEQGHELLTKDIPYEGKQN